MRELKQLRAERIHPLDLYDILNEPHAELVDVIRGENTVCLPKTGKIFILTCLEPIKSETGKRLEKELVDKQVVK